jgi:hypothetical protein
MTRTCIVKKATPSQDNIVPGSSSAEINARTKVMPNTMVKKATPSPDIVHADGSINFPKRGCQHRFKSTNSNSSCRVHAAYEACLTYGESRSKHGRRRDKAKMKKIATLNKVLASPMHSMPRTFLSTRPVFYSGTPSRILPNPIPNGIMFSAINDLQVIDTTLGAQMEAANGDTIFTLIPRYDAIHKMTNVKKTIASLYALDRGKRSAEVRGKTRITVAEDDGKYATVGLKPNRGSSGITEFWPKSLSAKEKDAIRRLMNRCENAAKRYLPSNEIRGLRIAQLLGDWPERSGGSMESIWGSLACGKNYYLNSHVDNDFFYSLTTVVSKWGLQLNVDKYDLDAEVCNLFTFAEQGIAVALRPGDMLIFNPLYHHCLSSRTSFYESNDVFCLSLYLKTAVVGQNDNSIPLK